MDSLGNVNKFKAAPSQVIGDQDIKSMELGERKVLDQTLTILSGGQSFESKRLGNVVYPLATTFLLGKIAEWVNTTFFYGASSTTPNIATLLPTMKTSYDDAVILKNKDVKVEDYFYVFKDKEKLSLLNSKIKNEQIGNGVHFIKSVPEVNDQKILTIKLGKEWKEYIIDNTWSADRLMKMINVLNDSSNDLDFGKLNETEGGDTPETEFKAVFSEVAGDRDLLTKIKSMEQGERKTFDQMLTVLSGKDVKENIDGQSFQSMKKKLNNVVYPLSATPLLGKIGKWVNNTFFYGISSNTLLEKFNSIAPAVMLSTTKNAYDEVTILKNKDVKVEDYFYVFKNEEELSLLDSKTKDDKMDDGVHFIKADPSTSDKNILRIKLGGEWKEFSIDNGWSADRLMKMINIINNNNLDFEKLNEVERKRSQEGGPIPLQEILLLIR